MQRRVVTIAVAAALLGCGPDRDVAPQPPPAPVAEPADTPPPVADLATTALRPLDQLRAGDATAYGPEAASLGELARGPGGVAVPPGLGVPFHYYAAHLRAAGLDRQIAALLADPSFRDDAGQRAPRLEALRAAIMAAPIDPVLHQQLVDGIGRITEGDFDRGVRVHGSTNVEALPGAGGAGLYDTVADVKVGDPLEAAVKQVWASVWNLRAYEARARRQIDHARVYGAVLIQLDR